ncbi:MAG: FlhC family transcriptional regulator [Candidatus Sedimenticola sp. (ex Thyasira tokunagai)]
MNTPALSRRILPAAPSCAEPINCSQCDAGLCLYSNKVLEAVHLMQLGARAGLVCQLTGLKKATANRLYRQLHGVPSPPGQVPFTDAWYRINDKRMLHTNVVWRLHQRLSQTERSKGRILIDLFETYTQLVTKPLLNLTRTAFVPQLMAMDTWHERRCESCKMHYATPIESNSTFCPGCLLYHRYRCYRCGTALSPKREGRRLANCGHCGAELMGGIRH